MLSDAACLALCHVRVAQTVQQSGFAMVNMAHDRDHRWPGAYICATL